MTIEIAELTLDVLMHGLVFKQEVKKGF